MPSSLYTPLVLPEACGRPRVLLYPSVISEFAYLAAIALDFDVKASLSNA